MSGDGTLLFEYCMDACIWAGGELRIMQPTAKGFGVFLKYCSNGMDIFDSADDRVPTNLIDKFDAICYPDF